MQVCSDCDSMFVCISEVAVVYLRQFDATPFARTGAIGVSVPIIHCVHWQMAVTATATTASGCPKWHEHHFNSASR